MAPVIIASAIAAVAQGAQMVSANQTSQAAKGKANDVLTQESANTVNAEAALSKTGAAAKTKALGAAASAASGNGTILTGPRGVLAPNSTPRKTLLGS